MAGPVLFVVLIWLGISGCTGYGGPASVRIDQERIEAIRSRHAAAELAASRPVAAKTMPGPKPAPSVTHPLTLQAAIFHALTYNLDAAVKELESEIQKEALAGARLKMLPSLTLEGEFSRRDSYAASFSDPLFEEGEQAYNYSRDKTTRQYSIELSWDLLNFGIAYYQARQAAGHYHIAEQQRRRVIQNLKFDVAKTFWQVLAAQKAVEMAQEMVERLKAREEVLQRQMDSQAVSELEALSTAVTLAEMQMHMSGFEQELRRSKSRLALFMGLPADQNFELAEVDFAPLVEGAPPEIAALEREALHQRPELFEKDLEERVTADEARIAIVETFPSPSFFYRYSYDDDSHLYDNHWQEAGVRLTFDLLAVPHKLSRHRETALQKAMVQTRRRAVAAAILTQLRIAVIDFEDAKEAYHHASKIAAKRKRLMEARRRHAGLGNGVYEDVLESEAKYLFATVKRLLAYVEWKVAEQRILNSTGAEEIGEMRFLAERAVPAEPDPDPVPADALEAPPAATAEMEAEESKPAPAAATRIPAAYRGLGEPLPYSLQLSGWRTEEKAQTMLAVYREKGLTAFIVEKDGWWCCYGGYYPSVAAAETARDTLGFPRAVAMKTPYAVHIGNYRARDELEEMRRRLARMGYSPYAVEDGPLGSQLLVGAFYRWESAEALVRELEASGIGSRAVRR